MAPRSTCQCRVEKIPWRSERLPTLVFWPGESHGQRSLAGYSPWDCKESDTTQYAQLLLLNLLLPSHTAWWDLAQSKSAESRPPPPPRGRGFLASFLPAWWYLHHKGDVVGLWSSHDPITSPHTVPMRKGTRWVRESVCFISHGKGIPSVPKRQGSLLLRLRDHRWWHRPDPGKRKKGDTRRDRWGDGPSGPQEGEGPATPSPGPASPKLQDSF